MKKIWKIIKFYGIWTVPITVAVGYRIALVLANSKHQEVTATHWMYILLAAFLICFFIYSDNWTRRKNGKAEDDIKLTDALDALSMYGRADEYSYNDGREKYMYPKVNDALLVKKEDAHGYIF